MTEKDITRNTCWEKDMLQKKYVGKGIEKQSMLENGMLGKGILEKSMIENGEMNAGEWCGKKQILKIGL